MRQTPSTNSTPPSKYDFEFTDYAPQTFANLRERFGIHPADYLVTKKTVLSQITIIIKVSLTNEYMLSQLPTPGKSGSYFYFSTDLRFLIKTIGSSEFEVAWRMLPDYYMVICYQ
jgi:1-phosphatidylinositol-4-phosphate 5-kinase